MSDNKELVTLPPKEKAVDVYSKEKGLDPYLQVIRAEIESFVPDLSTAKGRKEIASMARKVASSKTALDGFGKDLVAELKKKPAMIDAERKRMRDVLDKWRDEVRKPLTDYEAAEDARKAAHEEAIGGIELLAVGEDEAIGARLTSDELKRNLESVESIKMGDQWEEFESDAARAKEAAIEKLKGLIAAAEKYEAEQAELERLRKEQVEREEKERQERIRQEAIEAERKAAEQRANEDRQRIEAERAKERAEAEERERQHQLAIERSEREKAEAAAQALRDKEEAEKRQREAVEAERKRIADERAEAEAEAERKAANRQHRQKINRQTLEDLEKFGIGKDQAKALIESIVRGEIRNVTVNY